MQVINEEIKLYQDISKKLKLSKVWELLKMTPHSGQSGVVDTFDNEPLVNSYVLTLGRRARQICPSRCCSSSRAFNTL